jgi:hypothetical protein
MPVFSKLWDVKYLFGPNPLDLSRSDIWFFWSAAIMVVLGLLLKIFAVRSETNSPTRLLFNRFYHLFLTVGFLVFLWVGLRFENIPWLGTHVVVLALDLLFIVWLVFILIYFLGKYQKHIRAWRDEKTKQKYLSR